MAVCGVPSTGVTIGFAVCAAINILSAAKHLMMPASAPVLKAWPGLFGRAGYGGVLLWGLAYLSVAWAYPSCPWTVLAFGVEKLYYTWAWVCLRIALTRAKTAHGKGRTVAADGAAGGTAAAAITVGIFSFSDPTAFALARFGNQEMFGVIDLLCGCFFFAVGGLTLAKVAV